MFYAIERPVQCERSSPASVYRFEEEEERNRWVAAYNGRQLVCRAYSTNRRVKAAVRQDEWESVGGDPAHDVARGITLDPPYAVGYNGC